MINPEPDYKFLYEQSQKMLADAQEKAHQKQDQFIQIEQQLQQAITQALDQGLQRGLQRGLQEGHQEGIREGIQQGRIQASKDYQQQIQLLMLEANELRRRLFGIKRDNRASNNIDDSQLELFTLGASEQAINASEGLLKQEVLQVNQKQEATAEKRQRAPRKASRMVLPEYLEREEILIDPEGDLTNYQVIGEEVTEILVFVPANFKVKRIIRRKWALKDIKQDSKGILVAPIPSRTVKRGLFDESLLAYLLISKYVDHLPLYRLQKIFERLAGIKIPASTLSDNVAAACQVLEPLYNALKREVLANRYLQADETSIRVLESERKNACHLGFYWVYHAPSDGLVFFDYQQGRGQNGPEKLLKNFIGVLQSDGYLVYQNIFKNNPKVQHIFCMAHIRRYFDKASAYDQARSKYALEQIGKLYALEKQIRDADPKLDEAKIVEIRLTQASPILSDMKKWMVEEYPKVLPQSPIGKAFAYALKLWDNMSYYSLHGDLQIDNNQIENAIRPVALGRKNYMFAGSHQAAQNAAMIYSLLATCNKHKVNPHDWLNDTLQKLNDPNYEGKFSDLLPHKWKKGD